MSQHLAFCVSFLLINASGTLINSDFCMNYYPYTYSKCLQICSSELDPTCLDDQLCFCNSIMSTSTRSKFIPKDELGMERAQRFGVDSLLYCKESKFCSKTCQDVETPSFTQGIVCSSSHDTSIKSCVCAM